jgi:hyaluronate lyase
MKRKNVSVLLILLVAFSFLGIGWTNTASAADEYDTLRTKWYNMLTGGTAINTSDPDIAAKISTITSQAQANWDSMDTSAGRTYLWSDLASTTDSSHITLSYTRLTSMALAYSTTGSSLKGNTTLKADLISALDWMYTNRYNESKSSYDNWFDWEIGTPQQLNNITILLYADLSGTQVTQYMNTINQFSPNVTSTGANKVWKSIVVVLRGIIVKDSAKITSAKNALSSGPSVFAYVTNSDGFYQDGSFIQHSKHPYNGGYGLSLLVNLADELYLLNGSTWSVTDPNVQNLFDAVSKSYEPFLYKGALMDMIRGREMSRYNRQTYFAGHNTMQGIIRLSQFAPSTDAAAFKSMIKYWMQSDTNSTNNFYQDVSVDTIVQAKSILSNGSIALRGELVKHQTFPSIDRAVHLRPGFGFGVSMNSSRIYNYEAINEENKKGWYTSQGMTYLYNNDADQYTDNYWATVNPYRLPGTTVDTRTRTQSNGQSQLSTKNWTGGTDILGLYGIAGMEVGDYGTTLTGKKSWFMFDNEIVALGSGIVSTDNRTIETIVDNRKLNASGNNALTVNGTAKSSTLDWNETMGNVNTVHLQGNAGVSDIGYYFPAANTTVKGLREARTATWAGINSKDNFYNSTSYTRNYMTLWFDHGSNPTNAKYEYVILPNMSSAQVTGYAVSPDITVLENSSNSQAAKENNLNIVGANFWSDVIESVLVDGNPFLTSNKMATVMTRETAGDMEVALADPTQANTGTIQLEIHRSASGTLTVDPGVTVTQLSPTIKLSVDVNGAKGKTFRAKFSLGALVTPLIEERFDAGTTGAAPAGWTITGTGGTVTVTETPSVSDKSIRFDDSSTSQEVNAVKTFSAQTGTVITEFDAKVDQTNAVIRAGYLQSGSTQAALVYFKENGQLTYYNGATAVSIQSYAANTWYHFKIVANVETGKFDVYINDMTTPKVVQASFRNTVSNLNTIVFGTNPANTGKANVNNIVVTQ